jgi:hypothetical protein
MSIHITIKLFFVSFFLIFTFSSNAQIFAPSNYEDCVLKGLKEAKTDSAIAVLIGICRSKFDKNENSTGKSAEKKQQLPGMCHLYWDGIKTTRLSSTPKEWPKELRGFTIARHNIDFATIYVPNSFIASKETEIEMWQIANVWCK